MVLKFLDFELWRGYINFLTADFLSASAITVIDSSSSNTHKTKTHAFVSGMAVMSSTMQSVMAFLNSKPPSSLRNVARKPTSTRCFSGYLRHSWQLI